MGPTAIYVGWLGSVYEPAASSCPADLTTEPNSQLLGITFISIRPYQPIAETNELRQSARCVTLKPNRPSLPAFTPKASSSGPDGLIGLKTSRAAVV
jgi:hypothetical protein